MFDYFTNLILAGDNDNPMKRSYLAKSKQKEPSSGFEKWKIVLQQNDEKSAAFRTCSISMCLYLLNSMNLLLRPFNRPGFGTQVAIILAGFDFKKSDWPDSIC
jgi:hypothetical protein